MLAKVHLDYAERFGTMAPKSGVYTNTQMEENGWTSCGLASVELFLSKSNKASTWAETARRWMFSTATTQQDTKNLALLDGTHTVRQLTGEIFTALPDYMAENHGMVHPGYTASSLGFTGTLGVIYGLFGQEVPPHALFNRENVYRELKFTTDSTGSMHPMQGMDWPYLFTDPGTTTHAAASLLLKDPDAAAMEYRALETLAARQNSNGGRMYDADVAAKAHDVQDPMAIRECVIAGPAYTYLLHRVLGNGPKPTPERELEKKLRGVKVFPHSGFVFHRHRTGQASFSWRNNIMALPFNKDGIQTVAPASNTFLAKFSIRNRPESHDLVSIQVDEHAEGFAAALRMDRAQASVRQNVLFAGLPSGISLSYEQLTAQETLTVEHLEQGFLRIINEKFSALKSNCNGYRNFFTPDNQERFAGFIDTDPESDIVRDYNHPAWVNVDNRLGIIFNCPGKTVYHNRHYFNPWWAIADDLTLSRMEQKFSVKSGGEIASFTALLAPDQSHKKTSEFAFTVAKTKKDTAALIADGHLAAASFSDRVQNVDATVPRSDLAEIPVFAGTTAISDRTVSYSIRLEAGAAMLRKALLTVTAKGTLELVASETGQILATNKGRKAASITIAGKVQTIKPGTTLSL